MYSDQEQTNVREFDVESRPLDVIHVVFTVSGKCISDLGVRFIPLAILIVIREEEGGTQWLMDQVPVVWFHTQKNIRLYMQHQQIINLLTRKTVDNVDFLQFVQYIPTDRQTRDVGDVNSATLQHTLTELINSSTTLPREDALIQEIINMFPSRYCEKLENTLRWLVLLGKTCTLSVSLSTDLYKYVFTKHMVFTLTNQPDVEGSTVYILQVHAAVDAAESTTTTFDHVSWTKVTVN